MNNREITKSQVISALIWKLMERGGTQGIQFIITIVLARLLLPEEFGLIVLVTVFLSLAGVFVESGFNTALIQKKDADDKDFSSVFYLCLGVALLLYVCIFLASPAISEFYGEPELEIIMKVLSITLFIGALNSIQIAFISKEMQFRKLFFSSLGAIILSGTLGIAMAIANYGVWALVTQQLTNQFFITIILWFTVKWRPQLYFSFKRIQILFSFGWKLLISSLIDNIYKNSRNLIIGKLFSPAMLGFYNRGEQFPNLIVNNIDGSIQSVMLPTLASHQNDKERVKEIVRRSIITSSFLVFPLMAGLAVISEPLVTILLTEKWLPAVPFLQIFCASYALRPVHTANLQAINALGRSDIFLRLEIIKKTFGIIILLISIPFGVYAIALGVLVTGIISSFINAYPNLSLINYSFKEQWKDIMAALILSLIMALGVYSILLLNLPALITIIIQVMSGIIIYIGLSLIFKIEAFRYLLSTLRDIYKKRRLVN